MWSVIRGNLDDKIPNCVAGMFWTHVNEQLQLTRLSSSQIECQPVRKWHQFFRELNIVNGFIKSGRKRKEGSHETLFCMVLQLVALLVAKGTDVSA